MTTNPEKMKESDTEGEGEDSDEQWSDDKSETREIVLGLPALSISSRVFGDSSVVEREDEEARLNEQAVVAAELVMAAAGEAGMKGKSEEGESGGSGGKKKSRPKTDDESDGSGKGEAKKPKRKELAHPPKGPPVCHVCGKAFASWKAVFGHMRAHRERNFYGFLPPPAFALLEEMCSVMGQKSAVVHLTAGGGSSGGFVSGGESSAGFSAGGGGGASGGEGGSGLGIDLNVEPEEEVEEATESGSIAKFDRNKSPPKDGEEEDKSK